VDDLGIQASGLAGLMVLGIRIVFSFLLIVRFLVKINYIQLIASASLAGLY
jgi:Na+-transporting methylmalonyl-CoA/oxaloacetate decarboxylase gamma subunit